jgi:GDP-L-fucose synthase
MKVIVTGGSGMIGSHLRKICPDYIYLSSKDCNLLNYKSSLEYIKLLNPDFIIHFAAKIGGVYMNMNHNFDMLHDNLLINMNIMKICKELKIKKFIGCLSTCIFPDKVNYPITEEQLHKGEPHDSNFGYSYSKRILDIYCKEMNKKKDYNYVCIIPTNIFGENDNFNIRDGHVIPALIHKCYIAKKNNESFIIKGSGKALRQFIYAGDLVKIICFLVEKIRINEIKFQNIFCSPNEKYEISIEYIVKKIASIFEYNNIEFDTSFSEGQYKKSVSNERLKTIMPNIEFSNFDNCLKKTIEWFIDNFDHLRK